MIWGYPYFPKHPYIAWPVLNSSWLLKFPCPFWKMPIPAAQKSPFSNSWFSGFPPVKSFGGYTITIVTVTLPKTNSSPLKICPKRPKRVPRSYSNHSFSGANSLLVSGSRVPCSSLGDLSGHPSKLSKTLGLWTLLLGPGGPGWVGCVTWRLKKWSKRNKFCQTI